MSIDNKTKELLEISTNTKISDKEWVQIRQCLRCLVQGKHIALRDNGKRAVAPSGAPPMNETAAITCVLEDFRKAKSKNVLTSAVRLAFSSDALHLFTTKDQKKESK